MTPPCRVIDADSHVFEPGDLWVRRLGEPHRARAPRFATAPDGQELFAIDGKWQKRVPFAQARWEERTRGGFEPAERLRFMDEQGIERAVLFPTLGLNLAAIEDADFAEACCRVYNDWLAEYCAAAPGRLLGAGVLNLVDPARAAAEARRATTALGFPAVMVRPNPTRGRPLHHPDYEPLWAEIARLGAALCVHEGTTGTMPTAGVDRFDSFFFEHLFSHPFEQQLACASVVAGGVLERHPALRVAFLESGTAWVPYWLQRMDDHWESIGWMVPGLALKPSAYFRRQCRVGCEPDDALLPRLLDLIGEDCVMFSTDYPHYDAKPDPVALALKLDLPEGARRKVLGANAARFYRLPD
jgi:predicted TIM-barrel fold metal-dependent hydrolase